ncbi:hypothetical protein BRDID11002_76570 [Bradyrhizobium diazoefficiens]
MRLKLGYLALPLLMAAAITTEVRADGETIAVFTKNQTNPFFQTGAGSAPTTWRKR